MGQSLLRARSSCVPPIPTRNCASIYPARGSNVPKYRYPHQCAATSCPSRIWRSESTHGICPSDTAAVRLDTDGFCVKIYKSLCVRILEFLKPQNQQTPKPDRHTKQIHKQITSLRIPSSFGSSFYHTPNREMSVVIGMFSSHVDTSAP